MRERIKLLWNKTKEYLKYNYLGILAFIFISIIPIIMLIEFGAFVDTIPTKTKLTFIGSLAVVLLIIIFFKKIRNFIIRLKHGAIRGVFKALSLAFIWFIVYGLGAGLIYLVNKIEPYWYKVGFCFVVGAVLYFFNELKLKKHEKLKFDEKVNKAIEERETANENNSNN